MYNPTHANAHSPKWEVYRVVDVPAAGASPSSAGAAVAGGAKPASGAKAASSISLGGGSKLVFADTVGLQLTLEPCCSCSERFIGACFRQQPGICSSRGQRFFCCS